MNPHSDTATRAYRYWLQEGRPEGRSLQHWARAELAAELTSPEADAVADAVETPKLTTRRMGRHIGSGKCLESELR